MHSKFVRITLAAIVVGFGLAASGCAHLGHEHDRDDRCQARCCCPGQSSGSGYVIYSAGGNGANDNTANARVVTSAGGNGANDFRIPCNPANRLLTALAAVQWQGAEPSKDSLKLVERTAREFAEAVKSNPDTSGAGVLIVATSVPDISNPAEAREIALKRSRVLARTLKEAGVSVQVLTQDRSE